MLRRKRNLYSKLRKKEALIPDAKKILKKEIMELGYNKYETNGIIAHKGLTVQKHFITYLMKMVYEDGDYDKAPKPFSAKECLNAVQYFLKNKDLYNGCKLESYVSKRDLLNPVGFITKTLDTLFGFDVIQKNISNEPYYVVKHGLALEILREIVRKRASTEKHKLADRTCNFTKLTNSQG